MGPFPPAGASMDTHECDIAILCGMEEPTSKIGIF